MNPLEPVSGSAEHLSSWALEEQFYGAIRSLQAGRPLKAEIVAELARIRDRAEAELLRRGRLGRKWSRSKPAAAP
jgi:hypothetical protein